MKQISFEVWAPG